MARTLRLVLSAAAVLAFLALSAGLARVLAAANAERDAAIEIVKAQSHGDTATVVSLIDGCPSREACRARVAANVGRLHSADKVRVLRLDGPSRLALSGRTGTARIVWRAGRRLPVVQCVGLRREGDVLRGFRVRVTGLSDPIALEGACPAPG